MSQPWTAFYWRDYMADTGHLSVVEHGAYLLLMAHYYSTGRPIKANEKQLLRICSAFALEEQQAVRSVLEQFFYLEGDAWHHKRIDEELVKSRELSEKRRLAGKKGGRPTKAIEKQMKSNCLANEKQLHTQPQPHIQPQPQSQSRAQKTVRAREGCEPAVFEPEEGTDILIQEILKVHPKVTEPVPAAQAICAVAEDLVAKGRSRREALEFLLAKAEAYALAVAQWPAGEHPRYTTPAHKFFSSGAYAADPKLWERSEKPRAKTLSERNQEVLENYRKKQAAGGGE